MASSADIASLHILLRASTEKLAGDIAKGISGAKPMAQAKAVAIGATIAAGIMTGLGALKNLTSKIWSDMGAQAKRVGEQVRTAMVIGVSPQWFQQQQAELQLLGANYEQFGEGIKTMFERIAESSINPDSDAGESLKLMQIDARELIKLNPAAQFEKVQVALRGMRQDVRIFAARNLFGDASADALLEKLVQSDDTLKKLASDAKTLGLVLDSGAAQSLGRWNQSSIKLKALWEGITIHLASALAPLLLDTTKSFEGMVEKSGGISAHTKVIADGFIRVAGAVKLVWNVLQSVYLIGSLIGETVVSLGISIGARIVELDARIGVFLAKAKVEVAEFQNSIVLGAEKAINAIVRLVEQAWKKITSLTSVGPALVPRGQSLVGLNPAAGALGPAGQGGRVSTEDAASSAGAVDFSGALIDMAETRTGVENWERALKILEDRGERIDKQVWGALKTSAIELKSQVDDIVKSYKMIVDGAQSVADDLPKIPGPPDEPGLMPGENVDYAARLKKDTGEASKIVKESNAEIVKEAGVTADSTLREHMDAAAKSAQSWQQEMVGAMQQVQQANRKAVEDVVFAWITGTGKIGDIFIQLGNQLLRSGIAAAFTGISQIAQGGNSGGGGGGFWGQLVGGIFGAFGTGGANITTASGATTQASFSGVGAGYGGGRAGGGSVDPSRYYVVGERGPELFSPKTKGTIMPNASVARADKSRWQQAPTGAINVSQVFEAGVTHAQLAAVIGGMEESVKSAISAAVSQGGGFRRNMHA